MHIRVERVFVMFFLISALLFLISALIFLLGGVYDNDAIIVRIRIFQHHGEPRQRLQSLPLFLDALAPSLWHQQYTTKRGPQNGR